MNFVLFKKSRMYDAIKEGKTDLVRTLLDKGVNPNLKDERGWSFLYLAVLHGRQEIAELLVSRGAFAETETPRPGNVMHLAAEIGSVKMGELLLKNNPELLKAINRNGNTPLHIAAAEGNVDFVLFLIAQGAPANAKNVENRTPLYAAQKNDHAEVVNILKHYQSPLPSPEKLPNLPPPPQKDEAAAPQWRKLDGDCIAQVRTEPAIGYQLTEVFNFTTRERTRLYRNLETRAETVETRDFDDISEKGPLEEALRQLAATGVRTEHLSIRGIAKNSRTLTGK